MGEWKIMKGLRFLSPFFVSLFLACGGQEKSADLLFREGENAAHDIATYPVAEVKLSEFLARFPDDSRADVALQALARVLMNRQKYTEAIARYETLIARFPESRYCAQARFMIGYIYEQLGDRDRARLAYQKVLNAYPTSDLVDDAKISIQNLGKAPEQWLHFEPTNQD